MDKLEFTTSIDMQKIDDQLVAALEGGSNYWYFIPNTDLETPKGFKRNEKIHYEFLDKVYQGAALEVLDAETNSRLGYLSIDTIKHALELMEKDYPNQFADLIQEEGDAETADIFFQLCIMRKIVFG